jgi:hypothetical protein
LLFLQPSEIDYLQDLEKHGVSLAEYPLLKVLDSFPLSAQKNNTKKSVFIDMHPWIMCLQKALESCISSKVILIANLIEFYICEIVYNFSHPLLVGHVKFGIIIAIVWSL